MLEHCLAATDRQWHTTRRQFMSAAGMLGTRMGIHIADAGGNDLGNGDIPRRPLGRTGAQVSALGVGGHHLGDLPTADEAVDAGEDLVDLVDPAVAAYICGAGLYRANSCAHHRSGTRSKTPAA